MEKSRGPDSPGRARLPARGVIEAQAQSSNDHRTEFRLKLQSTQDTRSDRFNIEIGLYTTKAYDSNINALVRECAHHAEVDALRLILVHESGGVLVLHGTWHEAAWDTLLEAMPRDFGVCRLTLNKMKLDAARVEKLFDLIARMPALTFVDLLGVNVCETLPPSLPLDPLFRKNKLPIALGVASSKGDICSLMLSIMARTSLRELACTHQRLSFEEQVSLMLAMGLHPDLESLCWSNIDVSDTVLAMLANMCSRSGSSLTKLVLTECQLGSEQSALRKVSRGIPKGVERDEDLFEPHPLAKLVRSRTLRELSLFGNPDLNRDGGLLSMLQCLAGNMCLKLLNVHDVILDSGCSRALENALKINTTLDHLLIHPSLGHLPAFLEAVEQNTSLLQLEFVDAHGFGHRMPEFQRHINRNCGDFERRLRRPNVNYIAGGLDVILNVHRDPEDPRLPEDLALYTAGTFYDRDDIRDDRTALSLAAINSVAWAWAKRVHDAWDKEQEQKVQHRMEAQLQMEVRTRMEEHKLRQAQRRRREREARGRRSGPP
jgi:hypothetical protein